MAKTPIIFDFSEIEKRLSMLKDASIDDNIDTGRVNRPLPARQKMPGKAVILSTHDLDGEEDKAPKRPKKAPPRAKHNFTKKDILLIIDTQINLCGSLPNSRAMWEELKQFVHEEYDWWHDDKIED